MKTIVKKLTFKNGQSAVLTIQAKVMTGRAIVSSEPVSLDKVHELLGKAYSPLSDYSSEMFEWDFTVNPNVVKDETTVEWQWDSLGICELI